MEFTNTFIVPVPADDAFEVLTDLERVAPCFPGATLEEVEGDTYRGRVKVKLGPMTLGYSGEATVTAKADDRRSASITASGREKRGSGTAAADVHATLEERDGDTTSVTVTTDLRITGKPAQFGRGVMGDVGTKIIDQFATCLQGELAAGGVEASDDVAADATVDAGTAADDAERPVSTDGAEDSGADESGADEGGADESGADDEIEVVDVRDELDLTDGASSHVTSGGGAAVAAGASVATSSGHAGAGANGVRKVNVEPKVEALDLADVAGGATAKRLLPLVVAAVALAVLLRWLFADRDETDDEA